ncbi:hypothetical protein DS742_11940 [Lacrimispora amygdalina]|uniref:Uncharacterized protein n=1 Tax=Lacrimispora amygdalina TaxID=253257 RepID=A0A3E2NCT8_9FIRM|nr:hypothetical protein [Clostridium indicum]RFZ78812.1 hypothetical protein DS742_11940 [Clostridium indicum]
MVTEYIDCVEFKRLIEDKKLKPATLKYYLRRKGIIFTASNAEQFAEQVYTIFLGAEEISEIRDMMNNDTSYEKSLVMNLVLKEESQEDIVDILLDEMNKQKSIKSQDYFIENPVRTQDGAYVQFSYSRKLPGRNKLLEHEKRFLKLNIRKVSKSEVVLDIRQQSSIDSKNALGFINNLVKAEDTINVRHINLELLSGKNKVEFFDRIAAYIFELWQLKTITGITVRQGLNDDDEDEDVVIEENEDSSTLSGISQAVLNGSGLRSNEFVQESLDKGYYISAMRYRYEHKKGDTEFAVILSFKNQDLRVDIDKTYFEDEGKFFVQPLVKTAQNDIIIAFQNVAYQAFGTLIEEQMRN